VDNYATHKHEKVRHWLKRHARVILHFTPTGSSWMNLVERFFADLTQDCVREGSFESVRELIEAIDEFLAVRNEEPKRYVWRAKGQRDSSAHGVTGQDGSTGIGQPARHQTGDKGLGAIFGALRRKGAGAVAVSWQVRNIDAQVLLSESASEKSHDFFVRDKTGKEHYRSLRRGILLVEDGGF